MSKPFRTLIDTMPTERKRRIKNKTEHLKREMALAELRNALDLTQAALAKKLHMNQAAVSKFEHQSDIYISTLRKVLSGMGAELKIFAHFPGKIVEINQFKQLEHLK